MSSPDLISSRPLPSCAPPGVSSCDTPIYDIVTSGKLIGRGIYGSVYQILIKGEGHLAIKVIPCNGMQSDIPREAEMMKRLPKHENIVEFFDVCREGEFYFVTTRLVTGGRTLLDLIKSNGRYRVNQSIRHGFPEDAARSLWLQVVSAVNVCHTHNVVHRDIKLENVLVDLIGTPGSDCGFSAQLKLCDFGFATVSERGQNLCTYPGTFAYAAPNILRGVPYDGHKTDVWSLGVLLYILVTGHFPFGNVRNVDNERRILNAQFVWDRHNASVPYRVLPVIQSILSVVESNIPYLSDVLKMEWVKTNPQVP